MGKTLEQVKSIMELDVVDINDIAEAKSRMFVRGDITTNQIRNIYGEIARIRNEYDKAPKGQKYDRARKLFILLKPKLAYAVGRQQKKEQKETMEDYKNTFYKLIDLVEHTDEANKEDALQRFFDFAEAIVAYHKYFEESKTN
jgi:CRISPR-associated protein Csm2